MLERHTQVAELAAVWADAGAGRGSVVLVSGEAGAGKTSLIRRFAAEAGARSRILWGMCDGPGTARPLCPFREILGQLGADVADDSGTAMLDTILAAFDGGGPFPMAVVVEDAHWADESTLDALRLLGRRVGRAPAVLVVTFRDDEVPADHPLRIAVGAMPPGDIRRIALPLLSRPAVAQLAGRDDVDELYRLTGGNPFYVTEMLASPGAGVPQSVRDVVVARVERLGDRGRACVETAAAVQGRAERWLLAACEVADGVDEAVRLGVLRAEDDMVCFSHDLTRRAVEDSLPPSRSRDINRQVLDALAAGDAEPARLVHHAVRSGNAAAAARYGQLAARSAASRNAHQRAVDYFEQALTYSDRYDQDELGELLDDYAGECYLTGRQDRALSVLTRVLEIRDRSRDHGKLGASTRLLSDVHWFLGHGSEADEAAARAVTVLEALPVSGELVSAYAQRSKLAMLDFRSTEAIGWGDKAVELARRLDDDASLAVALITAGVVRWQLGADDVALAREGLELAKAHGMADVILAGYFYLASGHTNLMQYAQAGRYVDDGLAYCDDNDVTTGSQLLRATRAWWNLEQGRWTEAERDALDLVGTATTVRGWGLRVLGQVQARRGDEAAAATLAEARLLAETQGARHSVLPSTVARVELAWLRGDLETAASIASPLLDSAATSTERRWMSETAFWAHRVAVLDEPPAEVLEPYALQLAGRWREAASVWAGLGRPYEQADALAGAPTPAPLLEALAMLDDLGAHPRAAMVRRRLTEMGLTSVPRGPRESTRANPAGLTQRQIEVLRLLADGLTYRQIAGRLHVAVKTVDHHTVAVRTKLDVTTRSEAVVAGQRLGILGTPNIGPWPAKSRGLFPTTPPDSAS